MTWVDSPTVFEYPKSLGYMNTRSQNTVLNRLRFSDSEHSKLLESGRGQAEPGSGVSQGSGRLRAHGQRTDPTAEAGNRFVSPVRASIWESAQIVVCDPVTNFCERFFSPFGPRLLGFPLSAPHSLQISYPVSVGFIIYKQTFKQTSWIRPGPYSGSSLCPVLYPYDSMDLWYFGKLDEAKNFAELHRANYVTRALSEFSAGNDRVTDVDYAMSYVEKLAGSN